MYKRQVQQCEWGVCAAAGDIYDVFLNEARVKAFTMSDATVSRDVDGKFSMFGGSIEGFHRELVPGKKIVQDWRFTTWPDGVFSKARPPIMSHRHAVLELKLLIAGVWPVNV